MPPSPKPPPKSKAKGTTTKTGFNTSKQRGTTVTLKDGKPVSVATFDMTTGRVKDRKNLPLG